ncbi:ATP/GTP-binding protein [Nocardia sp. NPDC058658]|uniref:AAA family ATPase n=1 Tax=Nocardia sp. NPDC058658 TaxID=3346580 RepID=UPI003655189A
MLLTPSYPDDHPEDPASWLAVPIAGIFGANASGKSNVLHAISYMRDLVRGSLRDSDDPVGVTRYPFALDMNSHLETSSYVVDILIDNVQHSYGFTVDDIGIVEEWLHTYPHRRKRVVFHREGNVFEWGESTTAQLRKYADDLESNVLFLSVAGRFKLSETQSTFDWFRRIRTSFALQTLPTGIYFEQLSRRLGTRDLDVMTTILRAADTGIDAVSLIEESDDEWAARKARRAALANSPKRKFMQLLHRGEAGATYPLEFRDQSLGTQSLMELSVLALNALSSGSVLIVDEIDRSLHSFLSSQIIGLFRNPETNRTGAQLIFSSHDSALFGHIQGTEVLRRDHIWFTQKNDCGETELFPITAFKPRKEDNRERRYLAGRYGAVPIVRDEMFVAALAARNKEQRPQDA